VLLDMSPSEKQMLLKYLYVLFEDNFFHLVCTDSLFPALLSTEKI
jgi:hypothetical protein